MGPFTNTKEGLLQKGVLIVVEYEKGTGMKKNMIFCGADAFFFLGEKGAEIFCGP